MTQAKFSAAMTATIHNQLKKHLLQHYKVGRNDEDLCFALYQPSKGKTRTTALIFEVILPNTGDRRVHGNASFNAQYFERVMAIAREKESGIAFLHSHPVPGWQDMSRDDVNAEEMLAPRVMAVTGLPLVGLTMGTDSVLSARHWIKTGKTYNRHWCETVRVVGDKLEIFYHPKVKVPAFKEELLRTVSAWGETGQQAIARTNVGIIGAGSIGSLVAEAIARQGTENEMIMDFDIVKRHNLDRLMHATISDLNHPKVDVVANALRKHATADNFCLNALNMSITSPEGVEEALDCDVLFSCVDRPWPRQVLNMIAYAHLIPVIDGGIGIRQTKNGGLRGAEWRAHVAGPEHACLECRKQYEPSDVALEKAGLLADPSYIKGLPAEHFINRNQNVFTFAMNAAGLMLLQYIQMIVGSGGVNNVGGQTYVMSTGKIDLSELHSCNEHCTWSPLIACGDKMPYKVTR